MKVENYGQVFTPSHIVDSMIALRRNTGPVLEPSAGDGAFFNKLPGCIGIEIDKEVCPEGCLNMDFFNYPLANKFDTIIGNPPYVAAKNIPQEINAHNANLYILFIDKCIDHLNDNGELIFITPRDFLKATSSIKTNNKLYDNGTITHIQELGDNSPFNGYSPNCIIWRYQKNDMSRLTNKTLKFTNMNGQLLFLSKDYAIPFANHFFVKVGAVSGLDEVFTWKEGQPEEGTIEMVCSTTRDDGKTRKMHTSKKFLENYKDRLINRKIKKFDEGNWWDWGRWHYASTEKRVYVNCKTRKKYPFFCHPCRSYDGSVLAIFIKNHMSEEEAARKLNAVDWEELGFVCDGRYLFSQRSLESILLPRKLNAVNVYKT